MWSGAWPNLHLQNLRRQLESVVELVHEPPRDQQDEVTGALSRFLVVRTAGYLEAVVDECCKSLITSKSAPTVASFAGSWFGTGRNPSPTKLLELVRKFSNEWEVDLRGILDADDEYLRRELELLVAKRNKIAHGLSEGVGARKALDFVPCVVKVAEWFILSFDPR
jgi:hypothetical protein